MPDHAATQPTRREDYAAPAFLVDEVELEFDLERGAPATVRSTLRVRPNPAAPPSRELRLDGVGLELLGLRVDGREPDPGGYRVEPDVLVIQLPASRPVVVATEVRIEPFRNTALEGLYEVDGLFLTQCEAEGFRRITYYIDRPDVMARFTTTLRAPRASHPVLLSNGNLVERGDLEHGRHFVRWRDPFRKPCYLFALVAGDLASVGATFRVRSGRPVALRVFSEARNVDRCAFALQSLADAMRWDEETYGLECDLDEYDIVATDLFNMGAMENKGLNIFNSRYVLASPRTATDADFASIRAVVGHEYFHNWTGNRVTCRDWFQLSLKEGLTVYRDQQFSAALGSAAVERIRQVRQLRANQFPEDAGPLAHPVRPDAVVEINNFYTTTVYEKGAEVVRMLATLLGEETFRRGLALYLERHDGQAVTCDDFLAAMADAGGRDLRQFALWYSQAGTPVLAIEGRHDPGRATYTLAVTQRVPPTPGQPRKLPMHVPLRIGLIGSDGRELPLRLEGESGAVETTRVLELTEARHEFTFTGVEHAPVPSLLRGFSAPVRIEVDLDDEALAFLIAHDPEPVARWDAAQRFALRVLVAVVGAGIGGARAAVDRLSVAFGALLGAANGDPAAAALTMTLPGESAVGDELEVDDVERVWAARRALRRHLAAEHRDALWERYRECRAAAAPYAFDAAGVARRALQNACLGLLVAAGGDDAVAECVDRFEHGDNMTDVLAALTALVHAGAPPAAELLARFLARFPGDALVADKWLEVQASAPRPDTLAAVRGLAAGPEFDLHNPNRVRALLGTFAGNRIAFHAAGGEGYRLLADHVLALDPVNPQTAARLVSHFRQWRRFDAGRQGAMRQQLERIAAAPRLSRDVGDIAARSLA